jgi:uroporphyrinogen-III synthase
MSNSSIFISRNQDDVQLLQCFCEMHNLKLISKSLIEFNKTTFLLPKKWDVLFFPSPRAVEFFFNQFTFYDFSDKKIACAGKGTALALKEWVNEVDFVPENSGKINEVQLEFKKWLGDKSEVSITHPAAILRAEIVRQALMRQKVVVILENAFREL